MCWKRLGCESRAGPSRERSQRRAGERSPGLVGGGGASNNSERRPLSSNGGERRARKDEASSSATPTSARSHVADSRIRARVATVLGHSVEFNEILSVMYREGQKMSWHDDGERGESALQHRKPL